MIDRTYVLWVPRSDALPLSNRKFQGKQSYNLFWLRNNTKEYFSCLSLASFPITRQKTCLFTFIIGFKIDRFSNSLSFHYFCTSLRGSVPFEFCRDFYQLFSCLNRCFFFYTFFLRSVFSLSRLQEVTLFCEVGRTRKKNSAKKIFLAYCAELWRRTKSSASLPEFHAAR